jgi:hypothetical protein
VSDQPEPVKPVTVEAEKRQQCGLPFLLGNCPKCGGQIALTGEGRIVCRCGTLLQFTERAST